jgi:GNAT superfamily N-acetyltransferase
MENTKIILREDVKNEDVGAIRNIVTSSGYFHDEEIGTAVELIEERLAKGLKSGYYFIFADRNGETIGYTCFGPIPCTISSWDLYWIAVTEGMRGLNIGTMLLDATEKRIAELNGKRIYVETSSRDQYNSTRTFYLKNKYGEEAVIKDFYDTNDSKVLYLKVIG